jgi:hypothetical protein
LSPRVERFGDAVLYLGDCREILSGMTVDHIITDPPYEDELHKAFGSARKIRTDGKNRSRHEDLGFVGVNTDRALFAKLMVSASNGWLIAFSLAEGIRAWRDDIQAVDGKWDQTLFWIKPDSTPRFNGQGPARGAECAAAAWCGPQARRLYPLRQRRSARRASHGKATPFDDGSRRGFYAARSDDLRPLHGIRDDRNCLRQSGPVIHRDRAERTIL